MNQGQLKKIQDLVLREGLDMDNSIHYKRVSAVIGMFSKVLELNKRQAEAALERASALGQLEHDLAALVGGDEEEGGVVKLRRPVRLQPTKSERPQYAPRNEPAQPQTPGDTGRFNEMITGIAAAIQFGRLINKYGAGKVVAVGAGILLLIAVVLLILKPFGGGTGEVLQQVTDSTGQILAEPGDKVKMRGGLSPGGVQILIHEGEPNETWLEVPALAIKGAEKYVVDSPPPVPPENGVEPEPSSPSEQGDVPIDGEKGGSVLGWTVKGPSGDFRLSKAFVLTLLNLGFIMLILIHFTEVFGRQERFLLDFWISPLFLLVLSWRGKFPENWWIVAVTVCAIFMFIATFINEAQSKNLKTPIAILFDAVDTTSLYMLAGYLILLSKLGWGWLPYPEYLSLTLVWVIFALGLVKEMSRTVLLGIMAAIFGAVAAYLMSSLLISVFLLISVVLVAVVRQQEIVPASRNMKYDDGAIVNILPWDILLAEVFIFLLMADSIWGEVVLWSLAGG